MFIKQRYMLEGLRVTVMNGNFDKALRIFSKKVQSSGKLKEYKDRQQYEKPSVLKKQSKAAAKRREQKRISEDLARKK